MPSLPQTTDAKDRLSSGLSPFLKKVEESKLEANNGCCDVVELGAGKIYDVLSEWYERFRTHDTQTTDPKKVKEILEKKSKETADEILGLNPEEDGV